MRWVADGAIDEKDFLVNLLFVSLSCNWVDRKTEDSPRCFPTHWLFEVNTEKQVNRAPFHQVPVTPNQPCPRHYIDCWRGLG